MKIKSSNTADNISFSNSLNIAHTFISQKIAKGDTVLDATMGNGHDTLFLSQKVGKSGKVYSFDIQKEALDNTMKLLKKSNSANNVQLIHDSHEHIDKYVKENLTLAVFNLGYLPGADKNITTKPSTTISALKKVLSLLDYKGLALLVVYHGHKKGVYEKKKLSSFAYNLPQKEYSVFSLEFINQTNNPPILFGIEKNI